jgi:hypothetical protein
VASLKPKLRKVICPMLLDGMWSMKMNHSARPRKKSSRRSRGGLIEAGEAGCTEGAAGVAAGEPAVSGEVWAISVWLAQVVAKHACRGAHKTPRGRSAAMAGPDILGRWPVWRGYRRAGAGKSIQMQAISGWGFT